MAEQSLAQQNPRVITVTLEEQGISPPEGPEPYRPHGLLARLPWMLATSPYVYRDVMAPKKRYRRVKFDRGWVKDVRGWVYAHKMDRGCCVCVEKEPACLHFHHRDPEAKEFTIAAFAGRELAAVRAEVEKCDILCANCHAKVHRGILVLGVPTTK